MVLFSHLHFSPDVFALFLLFFVGQEVAYIDFIRDYKAFKDRLRIDYDRERKWATGAKSDLRFFSKKVSSTSLRKVDAYVAEMYPSLRRRYLQQFSEST